jgi:signal transduction histidine kinase
MGAVDFIRKPIHPITLQLRVTLHLELLQARRRLEEQNRQLVESTRLREDIEHIMRHDLKSPLNAIINLPKLLLERCEFTDSQRESVKMIIESGYNMLEMINRSLDLLKIEMGTYEFHPEPVDILSVMRRVLIEVSSRTTGKNLQVNLRLDNQPPGDGQTVMAMAETLFCYSMFSNLIKNAIEASPCDDVINIGFDSGAVVTISIDNGGEVPVKIREHFFDKFVTSGKPHGTGLGTYSARLIAQTQNGTIDLDTTVAGRTCVRVTIPATCEGRGELTPLSDFPGVS